MSYASAFPTGTAEIKKTDVPTAVAPVPVAAAEIPKVKIPAELKGVDGGMSLKTFFEKLSTEGRQFPGAVGPSAAIVHEKSDGHRNARSFLVS